MNVFDIFSDLLSSANLQTTEVNMKDVTKEELDETMEYLDSLKNNAVFSCIFDDDYLDKLTAELQAKWDIAHEDDEEDEEEPSPVDNQIEKLVDEYLESKNCRKLLGDGIADLAKNSYIEFANFIYNHE